MSPSACASTRCGTCSARSACSPSRGRNGTTATVSGTAYLRNSASMRRSSAWSLLAEGSSKRKLTATGASGDMGELLADTPPTRAHRQGRVADRPASRGRGRRAPLRQPALRELAALHWPGPARTRWVFSESGQAGGRRGTATPPARE